MHTLIVGERGVDKSTLIGRVLNALDRPVYGFETKKEDSLADELRGSPVYIYDAWQERVRTTENRKRSIMARLEQRRKVCENLPICRKTSGKFFDIWEE